MGLGKPRDLGSRLYMGVSLWSAPGMVQNPVSLGLYLLGNPEVPLVLAVPLPHTPHISKWRRLRLRQDPSLRMQTVDADTIQPPRSDCFDGFAKLRSKGPIW